MRILIVGMVTALLYVVSVHFDAAERLGVFLARYEHLELDELLLAPLFGAIAVAVFYVLRLGDIRKEIGAREHAEAAMKVSEERFRAVFDNSPHSTYLLDREGRFLIANRAFCDRFGVALESVIGRLGSDLQPPRVSGYYSNANDWVLERNEQFEGVIDQTYPDGTNRTNLVVKFPVHDADGKPVQVGTINTDISEVRRAEAALGATYEHASVGIANVDPDGRLIRLNPYFCRMLGYEEQELIGRTFQDITHPEDVELGAEERMKMRSGETDTYSLEKRYLRKDGGVVWGALSTAIVRRPTGELEYFVAVVHDITGRKWAEDALRESEERYRRLAEVSPDGIIVHTDGKVTFANPMMASILGASVPDEIVGREAIDFVPEDDRERVRRRREDADRGIAHGFHEGAYLRLDGATVPVERAIARISWQGKQSYLVVTRDITERKAAEQALRESEERFREFAESLPEIVFETDRNGNIAFLNRQGLRIIGYSEEEYRAGIPITDLALPEDRDRGRRNIERILKGEDTGPTEYALMRKDGSTFPCMVHSARVMKDGQPVGLRGMIFDITGREAVERALRESEAQMRLVTDGLPVMIVYIDRRHRVLFANRACAEQFGIDRDKIVGMHLRDIRGEEFYRINLPILERVFAGETVELDGERQSGDETMYFHAVRIPHFDADGTVQGYFALVVDTTESKKAEIALRESAERLAQTQRITHLGSFEREFGTDKLHWSDETYRILGYEPGSIEPGTELFLNCLAPSDRGMVAQSIERAKAGESTFDNECRVIRPDGEERVVRQTVEIHLDDDGRPTGLHGALHDITDLKKAEQARRETEDRFLGLIQNSPSAIFLKDLDGRFDLVNPRFEEWYGVKAEEIVGKTSYDVYPKEFADIYVAEDKQVAESGEMRERELDVPFADGEIHSVLVTKFPVLAADATTIGIGTINTDVTEQRRAEEQLHQAQKMEAVGQLTGGVAHDFNNLLTVILGNLEFIETKLENDEKGRKFVGTAMRAVRRGSDLTQRLLAFSRRQPLSPTPTDVNALVSGMTELLHRAIGEAVEIETVRASGLWQAMVDASQLENAILNLALNARDAMPEGGRLTIETANGSIDHDYARHHAEVVPGRYVMVAVSDTGTGMTPEIVDRVFDPFFTTKEEGKGSGLGLSMVFGFVKQSGGHVNIYSEPGHGTTVKLYLPRTMEASEEVRETDGESAGIGQGETILVVEDDPDVRDYVTAALNALGYHVLDAKDGSTAIQVLESERKIDMLFTDIVLPGGMNGRAIADKARELRPEIRILFTSGYTENAVIHHGRLDEGVELLVKPYNQETLASRIRSILGDGES